MGVQLKVTMSPKSALTDWGWNTALGLEVMLPPTVMITVFATVIVPHCHKKRRNKVGCISLLHKQESRARNMEVELEGGGNLGHLEVFLLLVLY